MAYEWLMRETRGALDRETSRRIRSRTYYGQELVARPRRLALMNMYLHSLEPEIALHDSIYDHWAWTGRYAEGEEMTRTCLKALTEVGGLVYNWHDLIVILTLQNKFDEASEAYDDAVRIAGSQEQYRHLEGAREGFMGFLCSRRGNFDEAEERLVRALKSKQESQDAIGIPEVCNLLLPHSGSHQPPGGRAPRKEA